MEPLLTRMQHYVLTCTYISSSPTLPKLLGGSKTRSRTLQLLLIQQFFHRKFHRKLAYRFSRERGQCMSYYLVCKQLGSESL